MHGPDESPLGRGTSYPERYDPGLLFPIPRNAGRAQLGLPAPPPFIGHDRWHAYELGWLDANGRPQVATATLLVPADSPALIESKSLKLYLNSFNAHRLPDLPALLATIAGDLSRAAGATVQVQAGLPAQSPAPGDAVELDALEIAIGHYGPPDPALLQADPDDIAEQRFHSALLKSNCPVTGQPDWADVEIACHGPRIDPAGLLRYLVSFRDHGDFHEQCVERIWRDVAARCGPRQLSVEARYTRRGGLDINPWRATPGTPPPPPRRSTRQ